MRRPTPLIVLLMLALLSLTACGGDKDGGGASGGGSPTTPADRPSATAGQGGAQDIGRFRAILESGQIPAPETLDDVGFFNEHAFEDEPAPCEEALCLQGRLGVQANMIDGANCTMVMLTMSTGHVTDAQTRPPLNLVVVVDTSQAMAPDMEAVRASLAHLRGSLRPDDLISLVTYDTHANLLIEARPGDDPDLRTFFDTLRPEGQTNLYDGLRLGLETADKHHEEGRVDRLLLLAGTTPNTGISLPDRIRRLADSYAREGIGITTVGYGDRYDHALLSGLAESGAGTFYTVANAEDLIEVFTQEVDAFVLPVATDISIALDLGTGYRLRAVHGTHRAELLGLRSASIDIPSVFAAHRVGGGDNSGGRRGGGGAILIEVVPDDNGDPADVGDLHLSFTPYGQDAPLEQTVSVSSPFEPATGDLAAGHFDDPAAEKAFVALNIYAGLHIAAERAQRGDDRAALGVLQGLMEGVSGWLLDHTDADIEDDLQLMGLFEQNLIARGANEPPPGWEPPNPWPAD